METQMQFPLFEIYSFILYTQKFQFVLNTSLILFFRIAILLASSLIKFIMPLSQS